MTRNVKIHIITHVKAKSQKPDAEIVKTDDAKAVAQKLLPRISAEGIMKLYSSPMTRTMQTAEVINTEITNAGKSSRVQRERKELAAPGVYDWNAFEGILADPSIPDAVKKVLWINGKIAPSIMESPGNVLSRLKNSLKFPNYLTKRLNGSGPDIDLVYVTHRAVIEFLCAEMVGKTTKEYFSENGAMGQGEIVTIDLTNRKVTLPNDKQLDIKT
jgi:broad specificity phosphatase PhoE